MTFYFYTVTAVLGDDEPPPTPPDFSWIQLHTGDRLLISQTGSFASVTGGIDAFWISSDSESVRANVDGLLYAERNAIWSFGHFADVSVNGHVIGGSTGVIMQNFGELHVGIGGTVEGGTHGVQLTDATLFNDGTVTGNEGVRFDSGQIYNNGTISSAGVAINYFGSASLLTNKIENTGTIQGEITILTEDAASLIVNNSGLINGTITLGNGNDQLVNSGAISGAHPFGSLIDLGDGNNTIDSRGGHIYGDIRTGGGNDTIRLGDEDNVVNAGGGHDVVDGGGGINTIEYASTTAGGVRVNLLNGTAKGADAAGDTLTHFQNVTGTVFRDVLTGDDGDNVLDGFFGHDTLNGGNGNDTLMSAGGPGRIFMNGGDGRDTMVMLDTFGIGAVFTNSSRVDGGNGFDTLTVNNIGNLTLAAQTLINVENIQILDGSNQSLTTNNATVANGKTLEVDASAISSAFTFKFDGNAETNGNFDVDGGAGKDTITTSVGADTLIGHQGADILTGGGGADAFVYGSNDSLFSTRDKVTDFTAGVDKFVLPVEVAVFDGEISNQNVSNASDLRAAIAGLFHGGDAIVVHISQGLLAGRDLLVVDINGTNGFQTTEDMVIDITGIIGGISLLDFAVG